MKQKLILSDLDTKPKEARSSVLYTTKRSFPLLFAHSSDDSLVSLFSSLFCEVYL